LRLSFVGDRPNLSGLCGKGLTLVDDFEDGLEVRTGSISIPGGHVKSTQVHMCVTVHANSMPKMGMYIRKDGRHARLFGDPRMRLQGRLTAGDRGSESWRPALVISNAEPHPQTAGIAPEIARPSLALTA
jgi:hypothetical protein